MIIVVDQNGTVLMWTSNNATPDVPPGGQLITLSPAQTTAFFATSNTTGLSFNGQTFAALPASPPPPDPSDSNNLPKVLKAILLSAGVMAGKNAAQTAATFTAVWQAMP